MSSDGKTRVAVIDGRPLVRRGLRDVIAAANDMVVCCEATSLDDCESQEWRACTDVAIVGNNASGLRGLSTFSRLRSRLPDVPIIVLSDQHACIRSILRLGVGAVVSTHDPESDIVHAVRSVLAGKIFVGESELDYLVDSEFGSAERRGFATLTLRETVLLEMFSRGLTLKEVAEYLNVSVKTARTYRRKLETKLHAAGKDGLLIRAARLLRDSEEHDSTSSEVLV